MDQTQELRLAPDRIPWGPVGTSTAAESLLYFLERYAGVTGRTAVGKWDWALGEPALAPFRAALCWAAKEGILPLSKPLGSRCARLNYAVAAANLLHYQDLQQVLEALGECGIPVVLLKGALLAEKLYPSIGMRPLADLDLLVPSDRVPEARSVLESVGFVPEPGLITPLGIVDQITRHCGMFGKHTANGATSVDLHWHLVSSHWFKEASGVCMEEVWEKAQPVIVAGQGTLQLAPDHLLVHLCLHQVEKHLFVNLKGYLDIDLIIRSGFRSDWDDFVRQAIRWRLRGVCYHALRFTQALFGTPIPSGALERLAPHGLRTQVVEWIVTPEQCLRDALIEIPPWRGHALHMSLVDRPRDLARLLGGLLWPDERWLLHRAQALGGDLNHPRVWHWSRLMHYGLALIRQALTGQTTQR